jgi:hypothetical protein
MGSHVVDHRLESGADVVILDDVRARHTDEPFRGAQAVGSGEGILRM